MFEAFKVPLSWFELGKRTINETVEDDAMGLAAQLAYYFFLALFPALLFLVALASFFPLQDVMARAMDALARVAPGEVLTILRDQMKQISMNRNGGLLTIGILGTIWSASSAVSGTMATLNAAYGIREGRPWWKVKLIAIGITIAGGIFVLISVALVLLGPTLAGPVANWLGLGNAFAIAWKIVQWPIVFLLIATAVGFIYYFGPDAEQRWEWITPGSLLATVLWIVASLGFRVYLAKFGDYNATYGTIGGVIVAMLWLYISGLAIMVGAEMNAVIEHAAPWGKEAGEKRPGERKKLGRLAAAAYEQARRRNAGEAAQPEGAHGWISQPGRLLPDLGPQPAAAFTSYAAPSTAGARAALAHEGGTPASKPALPRNALKRRASDRVRLSDWVVGGVAVATELALAIRSMTRKVRG